MPGTRACISSGAIIQPVTTITAENKEVTVILRAGHSPSFRRALSPNLATEPRDGAVSIAPFLKREGQGSARGRARIRTQAVGTQSLCNHHMGPLSRVGTPRIQATDRGSFEVTASQKHPTKGSREARPSRLGVAGDPATQAVLGLGVPVSQAGRRPGRPRHSPSSLSAHGVTARARQVSVTLIHPDCGARHLVNVLFILLPYCGSWCL